MTSPQDDLQTGEMVFDESDTDYYQGALAKGNMELVNEIRLKYFAEALAKNLTNPGACGLLKQEIGKKFDGDFDVLWETVKDENISGKGKFRKLISDRLSKGKGSFISIDDVEEVPLLQVSLPVNFEIVFEFKILLIYLIIEIFLILVVIVNILNFLKLQLYNNQST